ncbi:alpha/beta hydrolase-fold protein [Rhodohalobacter sp. 8-1]|uniref:alpha/beta hydrolase-fold protein n=1 Tax=Rhodohalobacter sp. 8-1 TaxID=3131972 RepID=UPI0030ED629C
MKPEIHQWKSPSLGKKMKLSVFGTAGTPVLIFPSEEGGWNEWNEAGIMDALDEQIEEEYNQFYCINSVADESLLSGDAEPRRRIHRQMQYEQYVVDEVIPFIRDNNSNPFLIFSGAFLGAYYAILYALKYPQKVNKVIAISGTYDIKPYLDGHYDDNVYYNNPVDFLPNLNDPTILAKISEVDFRLLSYSNDPQRSGTQRMSDTLWLKNVDHNFYVWDEVISDPWKLVDSMFIEHLF